ncbi:MAG: signal recognition particle-docking protein FtsY [Desulfobacterales bacterium]
MAFTWFKKNKDIKKEETVPVEETFQPQTRPQEDTSVAFSKQGDREKSTGFLNRLKNGLSKTHKVLSTDINELFAGNRKIDDELLEELEELLITSDMGVKTSMDLIQSISKKSSEISGAEQLKQALKENILVLLNSKKPCPQKVTSKPRVIMVIGVNGVGKTTTIGKLAAKFVTSGKKVIIAAADTFRAAAIEQLAIWAQRADVEIVKHKEMSDPAAVAYDGIEAALARGADVVLVDTAGRLHTRKNLMEELKKIKRAISKKIPEAPHEILLVLDATTGQNALSQAERFHNALDVTGIALTKLDGTAKGGIVVSICSTLEIPLKYIGIGEKIEDLQEFDSVRFVNALF